MSGGRGGYDHTREQTGYATGDKTGRVLVRTGLRRKVFALDNAATEQFFRLNGDFLYADHLSTGTITVKLNNTSEDPIPFSSQSMVEGWPIEDVHISWAAQPGLVVNLWYGWQARIRPPQSVVQLSGGISVLQTALNAAQGLDQAVFNGKAMYGAATVGAVAAQNSYVQLFAANNKQVYVESLWIEGAPAGTAFQIMSDTTVFATNVGAMNNKKLGTGGDGSTLNTLSAAGNPGSVSGIAEIGQIETANKQLRFVFTTPLLLTTGNAQGLDVKCLTVNQGFTCGYETRSY